jgi:asparagine synthase (glutamine-hydrolysing)
MCGICGIAGAVDRSRLQAMTDTLRHRGPDDQGVMIAADRSVGLGNRRLAILDLSAAGHMPMSNDAGTVSLSYNGEIYNFRELRAELEAAGDRFRSQTDTEVILRGYERWGVDVLRRLNGMFAIALWDARRGELVLARDRAGVKPLYYAEARGRLIFASEIKSLWHDPDLSRDLDPDALWQYLTFTWVPGPGTVLRAVRKLQPGHYLVWRRGAAEIRPYHDVPRPAASFDETEAVERFGTLFDAAVRRHLISDVPLGLFLSGGLDSTAILDAAARASASPVDAYTIEYRSEDGRWEQSDEDARFAALAASHYGARHHRIVLEPEVASLLPDIAYSLDEPVADTAAVSALLISRAARPEVTVLLSGMGADELMAGYSLYHAFGASRLLGRVPAGLRRRVLTPALSMLSAARLAPRAMRPGFVLAAQRYLRTLLAAAGKTPDDLYLDFRSWGGAPDDTRALLAPDVRAALTRRDPYGRHREHFAAAADRDWLSRILYTEFRTFLPDLNLTYSDKMSMAASIELRVPFLDAELADFVFTLPAALKLRGRTTKYVFRRAMQGRVPASVLARRKAPFASPMRHWLRTDLRTLLLDRLSPAALGAQGLFDPPAVERVVRGYLSGHHHNVHLVYALLHFQLWHDALQRTRPAAVPRSSTA